MIPAFILAVALTTSTGATSFTVPFTSLNACERAANQWRTRDSRNVGGLSRFRVEAYCHPTGS